MPTYTQDNRPLSLTTPLGKDKLLLTGCSGHEAISHLFSFQCEALAVNGSNIAFDKLLCQKATVEIELPNKSKRYFNGIVSRVVEGGRDETFTSYTLEIVPKLWLLTRKSHSRIFQQKNVPDILKEVFTGIDLSNQLQGNFEKRDYCVQYRETDFNFVSRLMEEEGIYYYFKHSNGGHTMVLGNTPLAHAPLTEIDSSAGKVIYEELAGGTRNEDRIHSWTKSQEIRPEKVTLWDHTFELPHKHLEGNKDIQPDVKVGTISHKLKVAGNENLEIFDWPGEYAQRFDGVNSGGGDQQAEIQKATKDNARTAEIRMQEQATDAIILHGASNCRAFTSGYKFTLDRHFNANGQYVLTSVQHFAQQDGYSGSGGAAFSYHNSFTCIPNELPYRPARITPKPHVPGTQTAVVVGPSGQEIFTDKYGRVQLRFHWDKENKNSCWVRVTQMFAGKRWGSSFWPRIGQEVVVAFQEGDPDQPLIVGSVYNADQMPPYLGDGLDDKHKKDNKVSGIKTCSTTGGQGYQELRFDDTKGKEQIFIHAEKDTDTFVKKDARSDIGGSIHLTVGFQDGSGGADGFVKEKISQSKITHAQKNIAAYADKQHLIFVGDGGASMQSLDSEGNVKTSAQQLFSVKTGQSIVLDAATEICLTCGPSFIKLGPDGVYITGPMVYINSGGAATSGTDVDYVSPDDPDVTDNSKTGLPSASA